MKIIKTNFGIASREGDVVYVNKSLDKYPEVKKAVLKHELGHSSDYDLNDLTMEFSINELNGIKKQYYWFIVTHPSSWTEYLPFWIHNKKFVFNPTMTGFWVAVLIFVGLIIRLI